MAVSLSISITQNSQSVANNTSNVTVKVIASWTGGSYNKIIVDNVGTAQANGWCIIDGTKYTFNSTFNDGETSTGSKAVFTKTLTVSHNSEGKKNLSCSASYNTYVSSGTVTASASKALTTIPRKSTLAASNGTLGTAQTLTVTKQASSFTHTITYKCGSASGTICTKSDDTSISWTPPLSLAQQNTTGTSVSVTFTITTYSGNTDVGSNTKTITCSIPSSVKPSVSVAVSDPTGHQATFGKYIQGHSKVKIVATASGSQGSTIKSYKTEADGKTYTAASVTTGVIAGTGTLTIKVTVTDSRGRTATASEEIEVLAYKPPQISELVVYRCNENAVANPAGEHLAVNFDASVTALDNKNSATYTLAYKKQTDDEYTTEVLSALSGTYVIFGATSVFDADPAASYNVLLSVEDSFASTAKTAVGSSARKVWSLLKKAGQIVGMAIGKIAEFEDVFEIGFQTLFTGGIRHPVIEPETDLNDVRTPNTYVGANVSTHNYGNCPLIAGTFTLEVVGMGEEGQVKQRVTSCDKTASRAWERIYYGGSWGEWVCVSDFDGQLLWSGGYYMTADHSISLSEPISKQRNGVVLVFSEYANDAPANFGFNHVFVPKMTVAMHPGASQCFLMCSTSLVYFAYKRLYFYDDHIVGHADNNATMETSAGVKNTSSHFVLRYVIGV